MKQPKVLLQYVQYCSQQLKMLVFDFNRFGAEELSAYEDALACSNGFTILFYAGLCQDGDVRLVGGNSYYCAPDSGSCLGHNVHTLHTHELLLATGPTALYYVFKPC